MEPRRESPQKHGARERPSLASYSAALRRPLHDQPLSWWDRAAIDCAGTCTQRIPIVRRNCQSRLRGGTLLRRNAAAPWPVWQPLLLLASHSPSSEPPCARLCV
eukprot:3607720-Rhodomonas_salina.1